MADMDKYCLFSAPYSFLGDMKEEFQKAIPTKFCEIWDRAALTPDSFLSIWIVNQGQRFVIGLEEFGLFPALSVIITPSTASNHIDKEDCRAKGVAVYTLLDDRQGLNTISASAEFTFLLLLNTLRRPDVVIQEVAAGRWRENEEMLRGQELNGRQVGLVGMGRIGQRLAKWCSAFEAKVSYYDPYVTFPDYPQRPLEQIFSESDIVCICCALTPKTTGMIDKSLLRRLKHNASFINTSRGEVLREEDLVEVLKERHDIKVALDVLSAEVTGNQFKSALIALHKQGRVVISPHIAGATVESQTKAAAIALNLLRHHDSVQIYS